MIANQQIRRGQLDETCVRMQMLGDVERSLQNKCQVELENIFKTTRDERKVVLIEGGPGSGKSTLAMHILQRISSGSLFTEFQVPILIQLRDPAIQEAECIADLLPGRDKVMLQQAEEKICSTDGEGVMFILDGWDELSPNLQTKSMFRDLIQPTSKPSCKWTLFIFNFLNNAHPRLARFGGAAESTAVGRFFVQHACTLTTYTKHKTKYSPWIAAARERLTLK